MERKTRKKPQRPQNSVRKLPVSFRLQFSDLWENPELVLSKMANSWLPKAGRVIPEFLFTKFPYIQAISLIMLLAERAVKVRQPPMHPYLIYAVAGCSIIAGVMMSARIKSHVAALLYAAVLGYLSINAYTNKQFNFSKHDRNRIASRHLGCVGMYLIYYVIKTQKESRLLQRLGELCITTYLLGSAYEFNESYENRRAFVELVPGGIYARYFITLLYVCAGLCFLAGYFLKDISLTAVFSLTFYVMLVDCRLAYWTYRGMAYWNQVRLLIDSINLMVGFVMCMNYYENIVQVEQEAPTKEEEMEEKGEEQEDSEEHAKAE